MNFDFLTGWLSYPISEAITRLAGCALWISWNTGYVQERDFRCDYIIIAY